MPWDHSARLSALLAVFGSQSSSLAIVLVAVLFNMLVGHFVFRFRLDDLLGVTCGVAANPAHAVFASKLVATDRTDIAYAITFPTGTIMKILLLQVMLSLLG